MRRRGHIKVYPNTRRKSEPLEGAFTLSQGRLFQEEILVVSKVQYAIWENAREYVERWKLLILDVVWEKWVILHGRDQSDRDSDDLLSFLSQLINSLV